MRVSEKAFRVAMMVLLVAVLSVLLGYVVERLWNWLMPGIFGLRAINYWQAVGLLFLSKLLLGGFHPRGGGGRGGHRGWKRKMERRWAGMSPEEREKLRAGMRGRHGCGWGPGDRALFRDEVPSRWGRPREEETPAKETV